MEKGSPIVGSLFNRLLGWYLIVLAAVIAVQFTIEFTYENASITSIQVWHVLDWFSLVGFAVCVCTNLLYMRNYRSVSELTWQKFASNTAFYLSIALTLAFLHNFVGMLAGGKDDLLFWKFINAIQIPLFAATGFRLARS